MKQTNYLTGVICRYQAIFLMLMLSMYASAIAAQEKSDQFRNVIINGQTQALLEANGSMMTTGRISGHFKFTDESLEKGIVLVEALNVVNFGVDQAMVTGVKVPQNPTATLGFVLDPREKQVLKVDPQSGMLVGALAGRISMDQFFELTDPKTRGDGHDEDMQTLPATLNVRINLEDALKQPARKEIENGVMQHKLDAEFELQAKAFEPLSIRNDVALKIKAVPLVFEVEWWGVLEAARSLCIQPVRIGRFVVTWQQWPFGIAIPQISVLYSGDGLAFGSPGANTQWDKADIIFNVRDWITVWNSSYSTLTDAEEPALRAEVNEDDCIEVFFVDAFSPQTRDGGGNTVSGGTESSKVISSDENADFGVDFTHLAHEYGHVLTLKHPGQGFPTAASPHRIDGSTNTLMCGSGFNNDNPTRNSEWNEDSVANPLLRFTFKIRGQSPDCINDADCGACP